MRHLGSTFICDSKISSSVSAANAITIRRVRDGKRVTGQFKKIKGLFHQFVTCPVRSATQYYRVVAVIHDRPSGFFWIIVQF